MAISRGRGASQVFNNKLLMGNVLPVNTIAPVISGNNRVGQTLTCATGIWTGTEPIIYTYQWYKGVIAISGATSSTYVLTLNEAGDTNIKCIVTATNSVGSISADSNIYASILIPRATVAETIPRVTGKTLYSGTVRYVDGSNSTGVASNANAGTNPALPKLTITSAYSASTDGDIIQLISNLDLKNEAGGYWSANTPGKGVLVRGTIGTPSAITITHTGVSPIFLIRIRDTNKLQFQSLTFSHNQTKELFYIGCDSPAINATKWLTLKSCVFDFQNAGVNTPSLIRPITITTLDTNDIFFEVDSCTLTSTKSPSYTWFGTSGLPTTATYLINGCTFNSNGFATFSSGDTNKAKYCFYDNIINQAAGGTVLSFSTDTPAPTNLGQVVDLRSNTIVVADTFNPHGILFGRGTDSVYAVNNNVTIPTTSSSLAIGLVIKTRSTNVGDSYFGGNYIDAPRPFYIKGGSKITATYNSCLANYSTRSGFDVDNPIEADQPTGILSSLNVVNYNNFIGNYSGIICYSTAASQNVKQTMQGWTMNNNVYYGELGLYIRDAQTNTDYTIAQRASFWAGSQDIDSIMVNTNNIIYNP
jgi:hypothetical protein